MKSFTQLLPNRDASLPPRLPSNIKGSLHLPSFSHSVERKQAYSGKETLQSSPEQFNSLTNSSEDSDTLCSWSPCSVENMNTPYRNKLRAHQAAFNLHACSFPPHLTIVHSFEPFPIILHAISIMQN